MALILDTGPLYASLYINDRRHVEARGLIHATSEALIIPSPVLVEVEQLIGSRLHSGILVALLDHVVLGAYEIEDLQVDDYRRARDLCSRYTDSDIGLVDAAVLAIVERLNEPKLATLDHRHFGILRPRHVESLTLLP
jgi:predicted nucleic acid-binding protein